MQTSWLPRVSVAVAALLVLAAPTSTYAQSSQGGLRGTVRDAQSVIPSVAVTLLNEANGVSRETLSNDVGEYSFPAVDPATYTVKVAVQGFKAFERRGVRVSTQAFVGLDITLEVGALEETITVTAQSPLIETTNASVGGVIDSQALDSIPTAGRSIFLMANLEPTVQSAATRGTACRIKSATPRCPWAVAPFTPTTISSTAFR